MADEECNPKKLGPKHELDFLYDIDRAYSDEKVNDVFKNNFSNLENMKVTQLNEDTNGYYSEEKAKDLFYLNDKENIPVTQVKEESYNIGKKFETNLELESNIGAIKRIASSLNNNSIPCKMSRNETEIVIRPDLENNFENSTKGKNDSLFENLFGRRTAANFRINNHVYRSVIHTKVKINGNLVEPTNGTRCSVQFEEQREYIEFHVVGNSLRKRKSKNNHIQLSLQSIFAEQLQAMPKKYINAIVFDREHKCLALVRRNEVIGGICFKLFPSQGFAEMVFCAITSPEQDKGYGAHLMNQLKSYITSQGMQNLLTYADNSAIGYFNKQGFTQDIKMDAKLYAGQIKEYYDATLMHCELHLKTNDTEDNCAQTN